MSKFLFRSYAGRNDVEKALTFLTATQPGFKDLTRYEQIKKAGEHVRMATGPEAAAEAKKKDDAAEGKKGGAAVAKLEAAVGALDELLSAAIDEDHDAAAKVIDGLAQRVVARRAAKTGSTSPTALTAPPYADFAGRNDIEKAQAWLCHTKPGFAARDRLNQIRLANAYVRGLASGGEVEAERTLMAGLAAAS